MDKSNRTLQEKYTDKSEDHFHNKTDDVLVNATTNKLHDVHPDLSKYEYFNHLFILNFHDHKVRTQILAIFIQNCKLDGTVNLTQPSLNQGDEEKPYMSYYQALKK